MAGTYSDPALILPGAVDTAELADGAVTNDKVGAAAAIAETKLNLPSNLSVIASDSYTGDGNADRAIPHGLAVAPLFVHVICTDVGTLGFVAINGGVLRGVHNGVDFYYDITDPDATNFYVGGASGEGGNTNTKSYKWFAVGLA